LSEGRAGTQFHGFERKGVQKGVGRNPELEASLSKIFGKAELLEKGAGIRDLNFRKRSDRTFTEPWRGDYQARQNLQ